MNGNIAIAKSDLEPVENDQAQMLLNEARSTSWELILDDIMAAEAIALHVYPFVRRAGVILNRQYDVHEKGDVIARFQLAMRYYADQAGSPERAITNLDLTEDPQTTMLRAIR